MPMTDAQRETLRQDLIREQLDKAEAGLEAILDGSYLVDLHVLNARNIVKDEAQQAKLDTILDRMKEVRLAMWAALGTAHNDITRGY